MVIQVYCMLYYMFVSVVKSPYSIMHMCYVMYSTVAIDLLMMLQSENSRVSSL